MASAVDEIIEFLSDLSKDENMRVTVSQAARGGLITGGSAVVGSLLGGPIGMFIGAVSGGAVAAATCQDFEPVHCVIKKMAPCHKEKLAGNFRNLMQRHSVSTVAAVAAIMASGGHAIRQEVLFELMRFVTNELNRSLMP